MTKYFSIQAPCSECPFKKTSAPSWLGPWRTKDLLASLSVQRFPCHQTIAQGYAATDPEQEALLKGCAGAAIYLNNRLELSRCPETAKHQKLLKSSPYATQVFNGAEDFIAYHQRADHLAKSNI